ncbi:MAG TPA: phage tail tape measure protein, partial [Iamia sp.]
MEAKAKIDGKVDVDTSEVERAESAVRDLDGIPDPQVDIETNADEAVAGIESAFGSIDIGDIGGTIAGQMGSALSAAGPVGAAVGAAAMVFGDDLAAGISEGFSRNRNQLMDAVQYGLDPSEIRGVGNAAGDAWAAGFGEGLAEVRETAALLENTLASVDDSFDLSEATRQAEAMAEVFGIEVPASINLARRLVVNGMAADTTTAYSQMADAAQRYQLDAEEIIDVMTEFAPVFGKMGVDGARAFEIVGTAVGEGLIPQVDQAAEIFEEFAESLANGSSKAAIEELGFSFEVMQSKLANGQGAEAMAELATALLGVGDEARRDALAIEIFEGNMARASNPERVLELLAMADATGEIGTAMGDATAAVEAAQTSFDRLQIHATEGGSALARMVDEGLGPMIMSFERAGGAIGDWIGANDQAGDSTNALVDAVMGLIEADGVLNAHFEASKVPWWTQAIRDAQHETEKWQQYGQYWIDAAAEGEAATDEAVASLEELERQTKLVGDALAGWADDSGAEALRNIYGAAEELTEGLDGATAAAFSLTEGWDLSTEAGLAGSEMVGEYKARVAELTQAAHDGKISHEEWATGIGHARAELEEAMRQAGFTAEQIAILTDEMLQLPTGLEPEINVTGDIWEKVDAASLGLSELADTSVVSTANAEGDLWGQIDAGSMGLRLLDDTTVASTINAIGDSWDRIAVAKGELHALDETMVDPRVNAIGDAWQRIAEAKGELGVLDSTHVDPTVSAVGDAWQRIAVAKGELGSLDATHVDPRVDATGNVWSMIDSAKFMLWDIDGNEAHTYIYTHHRSTFDRARSFFRSGGVSSAAGGGVRNDLVLVGEEGPELARLGVG